MKNTREILKKSNKNIEEMQVGDIATCWIELGHSYIEYQMVVTCINPADFEKDDNGNIQIVAFGEGLSDEDKELVETDATNRIDNGNFICFDRP